MQRSYLFVPPEEKSAVQALGACWDADSKRWYIDSAAVQAPFARWLPEAQDEEEFTIASSEAHVAAATTACHRCQSPIDVICIYCETGAVGGDPLLCFTISNVWAMDDALARQLGSWPNFRDVGGADGDSGYFANHCPRCGALQEDMYLHSEPGDPFFDIPGAAPGAIRLTPLIGTIRLSGDEHFEVQ